MASVVIVALAVRLLVAVTSYVVNDGYLIPDEGQYVDLARAVVHGRTPEEWFPGYGQSFYDSIRTFIIPLVALFQVFGSSRLTGQIFSAVVGAAASGVTVAIGLRFLRPAFAAFGGLVVALTPSQVLFSSVVLREAHVWLGLVLVGLGALALASTDWRRLAGGLALAATGLLALAFLREQTLLAAAWALAVAVLFMPRQRWLPRVAAVLAIAAVVPWIGGLGIGGWQVTSRFAPQLAETRAKLAVGAHSAIVSPTAPVRPVAPAGGVAATPAAPPYDSGDDSVGSNVSRLPQGLVDVAIRPYPWESTIGTPLLLARLENLVWYLLYLLAAVGIAVSARRRSMRLVLQFPIIVMGMIVGIAALTQGNLGTAFRHRDQVLWALALCAGAGLQWLVLESRWAPIRARRDTVLDEQSPDDGVAGRVPAVLSSSPRLER